MNDHDDFNAYMDGSMTIQVDGKEIPVQVYLRRAERAERLARRIMGTLYDVVKGEGLPGCQRVERPQQTRVSREARRKHYEYTLETFGEIRWIPRNDS